MDQLRWQRVEADPPADWLQRLQRLQQRVPQPKISAYGAQLLWLRGLRDLEQLPGFLDPRCYRPTAPSAFGVEMEWAVERLGEACDRNQPVAIWGDFDADGITATAVLWEGLRRLFPEGQLSYFIPNRLTESHGLSRRGLEQLRAWGAQLIVTCDTGSTSLDEIAYAQELGLEIIITDHHTLPPQRPPVVAMINPRTLAADHPLATLSGVATAYKLVEALYQPRPEIPASALDSLLDLVAIGLIADLVELKGDCRYLAQVGLRQLQRQSQPDTATRPGVAKLLQLCRRSGERPSDIAFGIGPRINAVSRIHGDASFCVELLTSQDAERCHTLALEAELANTRRRELQRQIQQQIEARIAQMDLSTTAVILLADEQWPVGILGLVAGQVAQQYRRPTVLLTLPTDSGLARGSARSVSGLDLYELFATQAALLAGFGGHPMAAGLSLPPENLPLLRTALNRQVREHLGDLRQPGELTIDLQVPVADLGQALFRQLKLLEPCGMGNPVPRLLVENSWFEQGWHRKLQDQRRRKVGYVKTEFELWDDSVQAGFPGEWWGHYRDELPSGRCDVVIELDHHSQRGYIARLVAVRPRQQTRSQPSLALLDWRDTEPECSRDTDAWVVHHCPHSWQEWQRHCQQALQTGRPLALAYGEPTQATPEETWTQLAGIAKYLSRTQQMAPVSQLLARLHLSAATLELGLQVLEAAGLQAHRTADGLTVVGSLETPPPALLQAFLGAVAEEQFRQRYFQQAPMSTLKEVSP